VHRAEQPGRTGGGRRPRGGGRVPARRTARRGSGCMQRHDRDIPIGRRLGEDFEATVTVRPTKDTEENRYTRAEVEMVLGAAAADRLDEITKVAGRAIEKGCTVGRTLQAGMSDS